MSDNPSIRQFLYSDLFHVEDLIESTGMIIHTLFYVLVLMVVCTMFEYVRKTIYDLCERAIVARK